MHNIQGKADTSSRVCPYLGIRDDQETSFAFPSMWNNCHLSKSVSAITLEHQRAYCLLENHSECLVFKGGKKVRLPSNIRLKHSVRNPKSVLLILLAVICLVAAGIWVGLASNIIPAESPFWSNLRKALPMPPGRVPIAAPTMLATSTLEYPVTSSTPSVSGTKTHFLTPTVTKPITASETSIVATSIIFCGHELDALIDNGKHQFVIHRVSEGENMRLLEIKYDTTANAIQAANYFLPVPLWVDMVMVIPMGNVDIANMPAFEPFLVDNVSINLDTLARNLSTTPEDLAEYNGWNGQCQKFSGWILIPRKKASP